MALPNARSGRFQRRLPTVHISPLKKFHESHDAKFVDFAGWEMPLTYAGEIGRAHV